MRRIALVLALLVVLVAPSVASSAFSPKERRHLAAIVKEQMAELRQPGVAVGVWIPGRGSWVRSFGIADRKTGRKLRSSDHFRIASITKTFTATATLQLVDQGKLSLDDTLESFIPGIQNGTQITIRNLLGMTSGIYDYTKDAQFGKDLDANPALPFALEDVIAIVKRHDPEFAPGEKVSYCDTNYYFLGAIIEQVTNVPLAQAIEMQILDPLRLRETSYPTGTAMPSPFARGYFAGDDGTGPFRDVTRLNPAIAGGAGAMVSTLADLRIWAKALATGSLLSPGLHTEQLRFGTIPNPGGIAIGYGLGVFKLGDFIGHNGAIYGYSTSMFYLPAENATIVVEGNQSSNFLTSTTTILFELGEYLFPQGPAACELMLSILLALLAALLFAIGTVFQQKGAMEESDDEAQSAGFLLTLLHKPVWLFGVAASGLGFAAQAAALGVGKLVVVQPILVASVVFALPLGVRYTGQHVGRREIVGAIAVTAGVAGFLLISQPSEGRDDAPVVEWLIAGGILGAITAVLVLASRGRRPGLKAAFLGTAAGILFGLISALTKSTVDRLEVGVVDVIADWHLWVLIAVSVVAFTILQSALQAGALAPALATLMAFETVAGGAIGVILFEEQLESSPARVVGAVLVLLVALAGLILLSKSEGAAHGAQATSAVPAEPEVEAAT